MADKVIDTSSPVWDWFELSYASYLVLPRTLMCGMPREWQERMVALLREMEATYDPECIQGDYTVIVRGPGGKIIKDPLRNYRRPPPLPYRSECLPKGQENG